MWRWRENGLSCTKKKCCKNRLVNCFSHRVVTLVAYKLERSYYERITLVWKTNCIRQPQRQLSSSSYNHNTSIRTSVKVSYYKCTLIKVKELPCQLSYRVIYNHIFCHHLNLVYHAQTPFGRNLAIATTC